MDEVTVQCPWCFEFCELAIAPDDIGEMVQDCEVCCRPWVLHISRNTTGDIEVRVDRGND